MNLEFGLSEHSYHAVYMINSSLKSLFSFFNHAHPLEHTLLVGNSRTILSLIDDRGGRPYCCCSWYYLERCADLQRLGWQGI